MEVRGYNPVKILKLKMLRDEFWSILDINLNAYFPLKQEGKSCPFLTFLFLPPPYRGFPWRILRRRGCLWTSQFTNKLYELTTDIGYRVGRKKGRASPEFVNTVCTKNTEFNGPPRIPDRVTNDNEK